VKRISVKPSEHLSLQSHKHRSELWTVITQVPGQSFDIPLGAQHRLENFGPKLVEAIEVQFGDYLGEDDIVRLLIFMSGAEK
jgi:mannose-6-phosphate isomerase-like protein (cupin superfamily)